MIQITWSHSRDCFASPSWATDTPCDERCRDTRALACDAKGCKGYDEHGIDDTDDPLPEGWREDDDTGELLCPSPAHEPCDCIECWPQYIAKEKGR